MRTQITSFVLFCAVVLVAGTVLAQTNSTATNAPARSREVWDYADELGLNPGQRKIMAEIRDSYRAAQAKLRESNKPGASADFKQSAREGYVTETRSANKRIGELLSDEQKKIFTAIRATNNSSPRVIIKPTNSNTKPPVTPAAPKVGS